MAKVPLIEDTASDTEDSDATTPVVEDEPQSPVERALSSITWKREDFELLLTVVNVIVLTGSLIYRIVR